MDCALLAPVLSRFWQLDPTAELSTRVGRFQFLSDEMLSGRMDFAITYDLGLDQGFERRAIAQLLPHAIFGKGHKLGRKGNVCLKDLAKEPLVLAGQGISVRHMIDLFHQRGLSPQIAHRVATLEIMRSFVANGLGVGLSYTLPRTQKSYDGKTVRECRLSDDLLPEPVVVAINRMNPPSQRAEQLIEVISTIDLF